MGIRKKLVFREWKRVDNSISIYYTQCNLANSGLTDTGKDWRQEEKGTAEDETVGWHHQLDEHAFEQAPWDGEGQGSLACLYQWGHRESDTTEWLNKFNLYHDYLEGNISSDDA